MNKIKLFLSIPSPRDNIGEVLKYQSKLPVDKLITKFYNEWHAYDFARSFFLEHREYTHFITGTDDIVIKPEHIIKLKADLEKTDYPILTGIMNVFQENLDLLNVCYNVPDPAWLTRRYDWLTRDKLPKEKIFKVGFSGFPIFCIRRDILEKIPFDSDGLFNGSKNEESGSLDVMYCWNCAKLGIPIYCDQRINPMHLRREGFSQVGRVPKDWWFEPMNGQRKKMPMRLPKIFKSYVDKFTESNGMEREDANKLILTISDIIYNRLLADEEKKFNESP